MAETYGSPTGRPASHAAGWAFVQGALWVDDELATVAPGMRSRCRLICRHVVYGRSGLAARDWALGSDERNAALIPRTCDRVDLVIYG